MNPTRLCPKCAAPLPADAPQGHCPQCLLSLALAAQPGPDTAVALEQATLDSGTAAASESRASGTGTVRLNSPTEQPGDTIGRYKLLQKVGEGGCGTVHMAEQSEPVRRKVALKVIKLGMDTKAVIARFDAERQALAMMDHPNIAKVLDAGATDAGRPYFVMELVRGIPITKYCDENHLDTPARLDLFTTVCSAIQHAHQKGIIHRDIKPSNILVTLHDGVPVPKVIDFGIAKATEARLTDLTLFTELHAFVGTPAYMSPEQAEMSGLDMDTRADIYSLGVLLYELLSGKLPFDPETLLKAGLDEIRRTIREVEPPRPSTRLSTMTGGDLTTIAKHRSTDAAKLSTLLRSDLDWIVMKALEKDRTRRYESASAFAQDIKRYLCNEAVLACPPSTAYLLGKLVRRHKVAFGAGAAVAVSLVAGLTSSTMLYLRERAALAEARVARAEAETQRDAAEQARKSEVKQRLKAELETAVAELTLLSSQASGTAESYRFASQIIKNEAEMHRNFSTNAAYRAASQAFGRTGTNALLVSINNNRLTELKKSGAQAEKMLLKYPQDERVRSLVCGIHGTLARTWFKAREPEEVRKAAQKWLEANSDSTAWYHGDIVSEANQLLGQNEMREGNVKAAGEYLLKAGQTSGSQVLKSFGPKFTLATELLAVNEREVVLQYLALVEKFWVEEKTGDANRDESSRLHAGLLKQWREEIRDGKTPDFRANVPQADIEKEWDKLKMPEAMRKALRKPNP